MKSFSNLIEGLEVLRTQGYVEDFNLKENCIECRNGAFKMFHDEFEIDQYFRFEEDDSSPDNNAILYAISSDKYNLKGTMINSYGIYSDDIADEMLDKLKFV